MHYANNRYQVAPKLMAEAGRPDGFRVLSLGYAAGPPGGIPVETLLGGSDVGLASLLEDIRVTQELAGFRHYISDAEVEVVNSFVRDHASLDDHAPPVWTSTYEDHAVLPAEEPTARVGIQEAVPGAHRGEITVRWDVALDMHDVHYVALLSDAPIDFDADPSLSRLSRTPLLPEVGDGYQQGVGPNRYPYQATLAGLVSGHAYQLLVRAVDGTPDANEDQNRTVLSATAR